MLSGIGQASKGGAFLGAGGAVGFPCRVRGETEVEPAARSVNGPPGVPSGARKRLIPPRPPRQVIVRGFFVTTPSILAACSNRLNAAMSTVST